MNLSWQPAKTYHHPIPYAIKRWLLYRGSMTERMLSTCGSLRIQVLEHEYQKPTLIEAQLLQIPSALVASIREIVMICDDTPWLYARTVIPLSVLTGRGKRLHHLGTTPLGRILFQELHLKRSGFEIAQMSDPHFLAQWGDRDLEKPAPLWARRSQFIGLRSPILLSEIFLPSMQQVITGSNL